MANYHEQCGVEITDPESVGLGGGDAPDGTPRICILLAGLLIDPTREPYAMSLTPACARELYRLLGTQKHLWGEASDAVPTPAPLPRSKRVSALYALWDLPPDFRSGSWDNPRTRRGVVFLSELPAASADERESVRWILACREGVGEIGRMREARVRRLDALGFFLEGKAGPWYGTGAVLGIAPSQGVEDERVLWRLEPIRPGVCDRWREMYEKLEAHERGTP